jgi:hypothetical protein
LLISFSLFLFSLSDLLLAADTYTWKEEEKKMSMLNLTTESSLKEPQQQQSSDECYLSNVVENGLDELVTLLSEKLRVR